MTSQRDTLKAFTDAAAETIAREIAAVRHEAKRERELWGAEHRALLAEFEMRLLGVSDLERRLSDRLATLRDGAPGRDGKDGADGRDGLDGAPGADGAPGRDGIDGAPGRDGLDGAAGRDGLDGKDGPPGLNGKDGADGRDGEAGPQGPAGKDGASVELADLVPLIAEVVAAEIAKLPAAKDGLDGKDGLNGRDGVDGKDGAPGKMPIAKEWTDEVHYEGAVRTFDGCTYQAIRDTGKPPGYDDWVMLAGRGRDGVDGRSFAIRGTFDPDCRDYVELDVVALGGASFAARRDDPGVCPGDGWQMLSAQGKRGHAGERGPIGPRGEPGPAVRRASIDDDGLLTIVNGDGTSVPCDLYPLLSKLS